MSEQSITNTFSLSFPVNKSLEVGYRVQTAKLAIKTRIRQYFREEK